MILALLLLGILLIVMAIILGIYIDKVSTSVETIFCLFIGSILPCGTLSLILGVVL